LGDFPSDLGDEDLPHTLPKLPPIIIFPPILPDPLPDFGVCLADAQVTFSKEAEGDYFGGIKIDIDDGTYKAVLYGKLLKKYGDIEKTLGQAFGIAGPYKDQKIVVWYVNPVLGKGGILPAACNIVPGTEEAEKPLFRCSVGIEVPIPSGKSQGDIIETLGGVENVGVFFTAYPHATQCAFPKSLSELYAAAVAADSDGDGVPDSLDNCPDVANYNQDASACAEAQEEEAGPITDPGLGSYVPAEGTGDISDGMTAASGEGFCSLAVTPGGTGVLPLIVALMFLAIRRRRS
jgi:MYXO-CTERM domain-containing protein